MKNLLFVLVVVGIVVAVYGARRFRSAGQSTDTGALGSMVLFGGVTGAGVLLFVAAIVIALLSGCSTAPPPAPQIVLTDTACSWVKPLTASKSDTDETKREIIAFDATLSKRCPPK